MSAQEGGAVRAALVTGAAQGVGRATSERLAASGWAVVAADLDATRLSWADGVKHVTPCVADVSTAEGNEAAVQAVIEACGRLDAAVLNAAISLAGAIDELDMDSFDRMIAVNLRGVVLGIRAALPELRRSGGGAIAVTASGHALGGDPGFWAYAATKHGVLGVVRSAARELGHEGIRINAACPSAIRGTGMSGPIEEAAPQMYHAIAGAIPLRRWCEADEVAAVLEFLVSPSSSFINGVALPVDGGASAGSGLLPPAAPAVAS
jgi:NAD(P)-dependent dehydrogenase (short-subunit alcohol dehydrogenase family)